MKFLVLIKNHPVFFIALSVLGLTGVVYGASGEVAKSRLETAQENLRISQATEARIAAALEELKRSGQASPEILKDYETYLERVRAMRIENRNLVRELETRYNRQVPAEATAGTPGSSRRDFVPHMKLPNEEDYDELAALDRELDESLAAFDEMLLKEMDEINRQASNRMRDLAEEAAAAAKRLRQKGVALDTSSPDSTPDAEEGPEDRQKEGGMPPGKGASGSGVGTGTSEEGGQDSQVAAGEDRQANTGEIGKGQSLGQKQVRRGDGHDDDIVARQLREAAEKETDPALKEKLWKEYEAYKKGDTQ